MKDELQRRDGGGWDQRKAGELQTDGGGSAPSALMQPPDDVGSPMPMALQSGEGSGPRVEPPSHGRHRGPRPALRRVRARCGRARPPRKVPCGELSAAGAAGAAKAPQ